MLTVLARSWCRQFTDVKWSEISVYAEEVVGLPPV